jgi:hypothetical protein
VYDYFIDHERNLAANPPIVNPDDLGQSLFGMSLGNTWVDTITDADMTVYTPSEPPRSATGQSRQDVSRQSSRHQAQRVKEPDSRELQLQKRKRLPKCNFVDSETRLENAFKYTPMWLEAFAIYALVWSFHPVLTPGARQELDRRLKDKFNDARTDYNAYQKEKKRKLAEKTKQEKSAAGKAAGANSPNRRAGSQLSSAPSPAPKSPDRSASPLRVS